MPANVVGSVRRRDQPHAVILEIAGSRAALWSAVRLSGVMLLGILVIAVALHLTTRDAPADRTTVSWMLIWCVGGAALLWSQVGRTIAPLLRTAFEQVTIRIDRQHLEIFASGYDGSARISWASRGIEDVLIARRTGGAGELRIIPCVGRPRTLLFGLAEPQLQFVVATMRDTLGLTARDAAADEVEVVPDEEVPLADAAPAGANTPHAAATIPATVDYSSAIDYARVPPEGISLEGSTIDVPPLPLSTYAAQRWKLGLAMLTIIFVWGVASGATQNWLLVALAVAALVAAAGADACFTRTTIEVGRTKLSRVASTPLGLVTESWAARAVVAVTVSIHPPTVEIRLAGGEIATLARTATADEAEDLADVLRRRLRICTRVRQATSQ
jgi:hypothetical protein